MTNLNRSRLIVGILFRLETIENAVFRFQNFFSENNGIFTYEFEDYQFLPIEYNPPERNINMDNFENTLVIPAIPEIITLLDSYNYFIDATITTKIVLQGFPNVPVIANDRCTISSYNITDAENGTGGVTLVIQAPDSAVTNKFPNIFYFAGFSANALPLTGYLPAVPLANSIRLS